jgi:hypothetical protein
MSRAVTKCSRSMIVTLRVIGQSDHLTCRRAARPAMGGPRAALSEERLRQRLCDRRSTVPASTRVGGRSSSSGMFASAAGKSRRTTPARTAMTGETIGPTAGPGSAGPVRMLRQVPANCVARGRRLAIWRRLRKRVDFDDLPYDRDDGQGADRRSGAAALPDHRRLGGQLLSDPG